MITRVREFSSKDSFGFLVVCAKILTEKSEIMGSKKMNSRTKSESEGNTYSASLIICIQ
jgi:hypothetical protein